MTTIELTLLPDVPTGTRLVLLLLWSPKRSSRLTSKASRVSLALLNHPQTRKPASFAQRTFAFASLDQHQNDWC